LREDQVNNFQPNQPIQLPDPSQFESTQSGFSFQNMALPLAGTAIVTGGIVYLMTQ
jgi:hypothetical protein